MKHERQTQVDRVVFDINPAPVKLPDDVGESGDCLNLSTEAYPGISKRRLCQNPACPEHGELDAWADQLQTYHFLFLNGILVAELTHGENQGVGICEVLGLPNAVTIQDGDLIEMREFRGPNVNYETWRDA